jgi:dinuclear metal center YbgI/SA1388 family protein
MQVREFAQLMETIAPPRFAEEWDNTGLLVGDPARELFGPVFCTIDTTLAVADEAIDAGAGMIVSYHPVLFNGIKQLAAETPQASALLRLVEHKVAVYSPHTALDAVQGGVADWLLDGCGKFESRSPITTAMRIESSRTHKLVVFVPESHVETVRSALTRAGAGGIGKYDCCTFTSPGTGTFFGKEDAAPAVGKKGRLEQVDEVRLEAVFPIAKIAAVVGALHAAHPYEIPAFDIYKLQAEPEAGVGAGRVGSLVEPCPLVDLAARLKNHLDVDRVRVADAGDLKRACRVGVCPGAGGSMVDDAIALGCDVFVTGEMRHHEVLGALDKGCSVILAGHTNTERGYLPVLAEKIRGGAPGVVVRVSASDAWPITEL